MGWVFFQYSYYIAILQLYTRFFTRLRLPAGRYHNSFVTAKFFELIATFLSTDKEFLTAPPMLATNYNLLT